MGSKEKKGKQAMINIHVKNIWPVFEAASPEKIESRFIAGL